MAETRVEAIDINNVNDLIDNDKIRSIVSMKKGTWKDEEEKLVISEKFLRDIKNSYDTADFRFGRRDGILKLIHIGWLPFEIIRYFGMKSADILESSYMVEYRTKRILFICGAIGILFNLIVNLPGGIILLTSLAFTASIFMNGRLKGLADKKIEDMSEKRLHYSVKTK